MIKKHLTLIVLYFLVFACKDNANLPSNENEITATNYTYEGDLYRFYLESEITTLEEDIDLWEQLGPNDPGYDEAQTNITSAQEEIATYNNIIENTNTSALIVLPIPPPPPPPVPCICHSFFKGLNQILTNNDISQITATLTDLNNNIIFSTEQGNQGSVINGFEQELLSFPFVTNDASFTGEGTLSITKTLNDDSSVSYAIHVYLYDN